eukprot:563579-Prymnesium_polylepis.1
MLYASEVADTEEPVLRFMKDSTAELSASAVTMVAFVQVRLHTRYPDCRYTPLTTHAGTHPSYHTQALVKRHGSIVGWLEKHAGFGTEDVERLRARLSQPQSVDVS